MQDFTTFIANHPALFFAAGIIIIGLFIVELFRSKRLTYNIDPLKTTQLINHQNGVVIDIRNADAYRNGHIIDALSISPAEIRELTKKIQKLKSKVLIIVCNTGLESQKITQLLLKEGYNAYNLSGGMRAWLGAQMPIVKESK